MSLAREGRPIAITGVGVIAPLADARAALAAALCAGETRIADVEGAGYASSRLGDVDTRKYANVRGMRVYPRNTQLQICAATLALGDAGIEASALDPLRLGTVTASTYAHVETLLEYDRNLVSLGIQRTNPTLFPLSLPSAPGALTALSLVAKAFAITVSDGDASGLAAIALGARMLAQGRADVCVVTAAFTDCAELSLSAARAGMLTSCARHGAFDRRSGGTVLGELAIAMVLEPTQRAEARGRAPLAHVRSHAAAFAPEPTQLADALRRAGAQALEAGSVDTNLSLISSGASGLVAHDDAEARALYDLLGDARAQVPVTAAKSLLGESLDASGLVQTVVALEALRTGVAPPIAGLGEPTVGGLRYLARASEVTRGGAALITSISHTGACAALTVTGSP